MSNNELTVKIEQLIQSFSLEAKELRMASNPLEPLMDIAGGKLEQERSDVVGQVFKRLREEFRNESFSEVMYAGLHLVYQIHRIAGDKLENELWSEIMAHALESFRFAVVGCDSLEKTLKKDLFPSLMRMCESEEQIYAIVDSYKASQLKRLPPYEIGSPSNNDRTDKVIALLSIACVLLRLCFERELLSMQEALKIDHLIEAIYRVFYKAPGEKEERRPCWATSQKILKQFKRNDKCFSGYVAEYLDCTGIENLVDQYYEYMNGKNCLAVLTNSVVITLDPGDAATLYDRATEKMKAVVSSMPDYTVMSMQDGNALVAMHHCVIRAHRKDGFGQPLSDFTALAMRDMIVSACERRQIIGIFYNDPDDDLYYNE